MAKLSKIKLLAGEKNISLTALAEASGVSYQGLLKLIDTNSTKVDTLEKIAQALEVPIRTFFEDDPYDKVVGEILKENYKRRKVSPPEVIELREQVRWLMDQIQRKDRALEVLERIILSHLSGEDLPDN